MEIKKLKTALTIAGSDSSGGAGIQADIKTMLANGVYAMSAITAMTAQNTMGVRAIQESTPDFLKEQLDAVFEDIFPDAVKIGMVSSEDLITVIADRLRHYKARNIVLDPVMVATSGSSLMKSEAVGTMIQELFPLAAVITPNIPEAQVLSGMPIADNMGMINAARKIYDSYGCAVLLKGGHSVSDANDLLFKDDKITWFEGQRIDNPNLTEPASPFPIPSPQILPKAIVSLIQWQGLRNIFHMRLHQCSILDMAQGRLTMAVLLGPVLCGIRDGAFKSLPGELYNRHKGRKLQLQIIIIEIGEKLK